MNRSFKSAIAITAATLVFGSVALAHSTGHESRTTSDCEKLPGSQSAGERSQCLSCIARNTPNAKWHYHPDNAAGNRCRPDDGNP
jgi:hypothetical protein